MDAPTSDITNRRTLPVHRLNGTTHWTVTQFNNGNHYLLNIECAGGIKLQAHFDGDQWADLVGFLYAVPNAGDPA